MAEIEKIQKIANVQQKEITFILQGEVGIADMGNLKEKLLQEINKFTAIHIKSNQLTSIDLACVQVLYALKKTAKEKNIDLHINLKVPSNINQLFINSNIDITNL